LFYVVLLAMVAGFLAMRLYSVLGKRTGHEQPLPRAAEERPAPVTVPRTIEAATDQRAVANRNIEARAEPGLRAIVAGEPGFDVNQFLDGAKAAYRMTLEAFWQGEAATLADLAEDDVRAAFVEAIEARVRRARRSITGSSRSSARSLPTLRCRVVTRGSRCASMRISPRSRATRRVR